MPSYAEKSTFDFLVLFTLVLMLSEELELILTIDVRKKLKTTNVSFAVVPEILCQLYTL